MAFSLNSKSVAMIPAAGFGRRLGALTSHTPKPLIEIQGIAMLERACMHLNEIGFKRIAINTHYLADQIHMFIAKLADKFPNIDFHISHEPDILDIGGGMKKVACDLQIAEMLIFNSDAMLYGKLEPLENILKAWDNSMDALMYLKNKYDLSKNPQEADFNMDTNGKLVRLSNKAEHEYMYCGIAIYRVAPLISIESNKFHIMKDYVFPKMATEHNFYGTLLDAGYIDIGTPQNLRIATGDLF